MKKQTIIPITIVFLLSLIGCKKKEALRWNVEGVVPALYGNLSLSNILPDTLLATNPDSSLQLSFSSTLYSLNFDTLVTIPDTTMKEDHVLPYSSGITFNPGQTFITQPNEITLDVNDVELTEVLVEKGSVQYTISSNIDAEVIYNYKISNAFDAQGNIFSKEVVVPAAGSSNANVTGTFALDGYTINLRGVNNNSYNTLSTFVEMTLSTNNPNSVLINNQDTVHIENTMKGISLQYARGYFGNQTVSVASETQEVKALKKITTGSIDIEQVNIDLKITNGIGVDAAFTFNELSSIKGSNVIALSHSIIGSQNNINRASLSGNVVQPTIFQTNISSGNSNIENWLENLPDSIRYSMDLEINPLGNVSGHNDFIFNSSPFSVDMDVNMPLSLLANNLTLVDTLSISTDKLANVLEGSFITTIENGFPLSAKITLIPIANGNIIQSETPIEAGILDGNQKVMEAVKSTHQFYFTPSDIEALKEDERFILKVVFDSPSGISSPLKIYDYYRLKFTSVFDFVYTIKN